MMTILHTLASTRADHGGTSRSVPALCEALQAHGASVHLVTAAPAGGAESQQPILPDGEVTVHLIEEHGRLQRTLRSPLAFYRRLRTLAERIDPDVIHDHGAWLPSNGAAAWVARRAGVPLVVAPRGMVTTWSLSHRAWKKRAAWHLYQRRIFDQAALFHATAAAEMEALRGLGMSQPVAVVPNGVALPEAMPERRSDEKKRALFLSRVHPKKGLPMLLAAWARVQPKGWILEVVGPSEDRHRAELERQASSLGIDGAVHFSGAVDDADKWHKYAGADLFVLPSHSENFGIVVAEALAAGVPVITTTGTPWGELVSHDCGWWVDPEEDTIAEALATAMALSPDARAAMGQRGRELVESNYTWRAVGRQMCATYEWIAGQRAAPDYITRTYE